jgi:hypothetical protein
VDSQYTKKKTEMEEKNLVRIRKRVAIITEGRVTDYSSSKGSEYTGGW